MRAGLAASADPQPRAARALCGAAVVVAAGACWAALCWMLARDGHAPSRVWLPIDRRDYYLAQAAFVLPMLLLQWAVCSVIASGLARRLGGTGSWTATAHALGTALGAPLIALFLVPDIIAYQAFGFSALAKLVRVTAPLAMFSTLALATLAIRRVHRLSGARAFAAAASSVFAQALLGAPLLR
jgi:hypothetical protein